MRRRVSGELTSARPSARAASLSAARRLTGLQALTDRTRGDPRIGVAVIDGPVDVAHPDLVGARFRQVATDRPSAGCAVPDSSACRHGTFVAGLLAAAPDADTPGLCPGCSFLLRPVFCEASTGRSCPVTTPDDLAVAIADAVDAGSRVINLSLGADPATGRSGVLRRSLDYAAARGALVITAAGNQGHVGPVALTDHPWLVPVAACRLDGAPLAMTTLGIAIGRTGLLAPGDAVPGLAPAGGHGSMTGTSAAVPFVTAAAALLWSLRPSAPAAAVRRALLRPGVRRTSIVPPLLDAAASLGALPELTPHPRTTGRTSWR